MSDLSVKRNIDMPSSPSQVRSVDEILFHSSEKEQEKRLFDVFMAINRGSQRAGEKVKDIITTSNFLDGRQIRVLNGWLLNVLVQEGNVVGNYNCSVMVE
jgi:hypothetical protein